MYEEWAASPVPHTPILLSRASIWPSPIPSPPPAPKARDRFGSGLGAGLATIRQRIHQNSVAAHTRRRLAAPTVDERGSPIDRTTTRPVYTVGEPVLRLDTPGRVGYATWGKESPLIERTKIADVFSFFFRRIGRPRDSRVAFRGF